MRILLIAGGWSPEREVSLSGAEQIHVSLTKLGHEVTPFDPADAFGQLSSLASAFDFAFLNLHGAPGEDGLIQALLDACGVPYQGSGPAGSFLALNKVAAKQIYVQRGLATPDWDFLPLRPAQGYSPRFAPPYFVKPNTGGSSLNMSRVEDAAELPAALETIYSDGGEAMIEKALCGPELTCAVLGQAPLPPILIRPGNDSGFFDYTSKYMPDAAEEICPAPVSEEITAELERMAVTAHKALGLSGYSRSDFILHDGELMLLETNTLPGMTPTSLLPRSARAAGMSFEDLLARLIALGLEERGR
jgi:D-alanine-D-alanine ligase